MATWCEELTHWESPWCWERLKAGGEGEKGGRDGWTASPTRWTCVWVSFRGDDGQGSLACCSPWGRKESDTTEGLNWTELILELPSDFPYFLQFKSDFCNNEFMISSTVSSHSYFWWFYGDSPSLAAKNIICLIFFIDHLVLFMCRVVFSVAGRGCLSWPVHSLDKTLLAFAMLHFVFQGSIHII